MLASFEGLDSLADSLESLDLSGQEKLINPNPIYRLHNLKWFSVYTYAHANMELIKKNNPALKTIYYY